MKVEIFGIRPKFIRTLVITLGGLWVALMISGIMTRKYITAQKRMLRDGLATVRIVVAGQNVEPNEPISEEMITIRRVPRRYIHANPVYPEESDQLLGRDLSIKVGAGSPILWPDLG